MVLKVMNQGNWKRYSILEFWKVNTSKTNSHKLSGYNEALNNMYVSITPYYVNIDG